MSHRDRMDLQRPWSPMEIEQSITGTVDEMEQTTLDLLALARDAAELRNAYESAQASAWLTVGGTKGTTEAVRKAMVYHSEVAFRGEQVSVGDLKFRSELADALVDSKRGVMRVQGHVCDLLRSLLASNRQVVG